MQFTLFLILLTIVVIVGVAIMTILVLVHDYLVKAVIKVKSLFKKETKNV